MEKIYGYEVKSDGKYPVHTVFYQNDKGLHVNCYDNSRDANERVWWLKENGYSWSADFELYESVFRVSVPFEDFEFFTCSDLVSGLKKELIDTEFEYDDYLTEHNLEDNSDNLNKYIADRMKNVTNCLRSCKIGEIAVIFSWFECERLF